MIIGGALSGLNRAISHSLAYIRVYLAVGLPIVAVLGLIWGDTEYGNFTVIMLVLHVLSVILLLPASVIANFAALRVFRPRSWRHQSWRAWIAGSLGTPFCWGGLMIWPHLSDGPPAYLRKVAGGWGDTVYGLGLLVLFSNLALLVGWLLPPWRKRTGMPTTASGRVA